MQYKYEDNTKLRIAILLDKKTNKVVKQLNKQINQNINFDIDFGKKCLPHITLVSGVLKKKKDFSNVCEIIAQTIKEELHGKLNIDFEEFYFSQDNTWFFLKLKENEILKNFIEKLKENIKEHFEISQSRQIHVTIAKSAELTKKEKELKNLSLPTQFQAKEIGLGLSGDNGMLINAIKKFKI